VEGVDGRVHKHATEAVSLVAGEDAELGGVADAAADLAGEDGGDEVIAAGLMEDERSTGNELAAAGEQDDVFEEAESAGAAAVLVVDFAIDVIGVGKIDELGAGLEIAVVPAADTHAVGSARAMFGGLLQVEEHELAGVKAETLVVERDVDGAAERHELGFDAGEVGNGAHGVEHFFEEAAADGGLGRFGGDVEAADEALLLLEDVKRVADGGAFFEGHGTGESVSFKEALDEIESAAIIPMEVVAPVAGFFFEKRFQLADGCLAQVDNIHGKVASSATSAARIPS